MEVKLNVCLMSDACCEREKEIKARLVEHGKSMLPKPIPTSEQEDKE